MHPRKLASTPTSSSGMLRPRKRSSTNTSTSTVVSATTSRSPTTVIAPSSASPTQQSEPTSPLSWYAGISAMSVSTAISASSSASVQSTVSSGASFNSSSSAQPAATTSSSRSFQPQPTPPDRPQRPQSIPISFLINPVPQSPRPFTFSSPAPSSPSPPPFEASSVVTALPIEQSSTRPYQFNPQCRSGSPTLPPATIPSRRNLLFAPTTSRSLSERRSYSTSTLSQLNTEAGNSLNYSAVSPTTHPESSAERHPAVFSANPSTSTSKKPSTSHADDAPTSNGIDFSHSESMDSVRQKRSLSSNGTSGSSSSNRGRSRRSNNKAMKDEKQLQLQQLQQQAIARSEEPAPRQATLRKTTNPDLKTTITGKILHKPKKAGVNKKNTTYNRFLQQRSKHFAKHHPHLTPQQRMKLIAEEWAVSEKNTHTTRRRSRFPIVDSGTRHHQQQWPLDPVLISSSSSSSSLPATATAYSSSSSTGSYAVTGSSSDTTNTTNTSISSSASSSSFAITSTVSTLHDPFPTNTRREAGPFRLVDPFLSRTAPTTSTAATATTRPADASAAVVELSQPRARSSDCIPHSSSSVYIEQDRMGEEEYEE